MKRNKQYKVLLLFYAFLRLRVRCEETCNSYHKDVGCENITLRNGHVCYEWPNWRVWESSSATFVCSSPYKLNTKQNTINCKMKVLCISSCYAWDEHATPSCDEEGISAESIYFIVRPGSPSSKSTTTFAEAHVNVSPNVTSVTNVAETNSLVSDSSSDIEVSTEVVFRTSAHLDQTSGMKFTTKAEQTYSTNTEVMYVTIPSVLGVILVVLVAVVLICRKPCRRDATKHSKDNDYPLHAFSQQETVHSQTDNTSSATVVESENKTATGSSTNDSIYDNDKVNNKDVQGCLDDSYDHLGMKNPIVQDQTYSHTSQSYRPEMYCMSGIPREQYSGETYNTLNKDVLPTKTQGMYDLEMTNDLKVIQDVSDAEYSHAFQKEVTDLAKLHYTDDEQTVYLNVYPSS